MCAKRGPPYMVPHPLFKVEGQQAPGMLCCSQGQPHRCNQPHLPRFPHTQPFLIIPATPTGPNPPPPAPTRAPPILPRPHLLMRGERLRLHHHRPRLGVNLGVQARPPAEGGAVGRLGGTQGGVV